MKITASPHWQSFLRSRGSALLEKRLKFLRSVTESRQFTKEITKICKKNIIITKNNTYIKYESVKHYSNCQISTESIKELGTTNIIYYFIPYPFTEKRQLSDLRLGISIGEFHSPIEEFKEECKVSTGWSICGSVEDVNTIWLEQFVELRGVNNGELIYKGTHKIWKYLPNQDMWGEGHSEKVIKDGIKVIAHETWKDNLQERFRDFWAEQSDLSTTFYHYGEKERFDNIVTVINRWEKKLNDFEYNETIHFDFDGKSWGTKDGKKGDEDFHEKWNSENGEKFIEKWSDQKQTDGSLKKWGEKIKELSDGTQETENWDEIINAEGTYNELTIKKQVNHADGTKSGENSYSNSAKKSWNEKWEERENSKLIIKNEDDGFGHKSQETTGVGFGEEKYNYNDKYYEDVALNERYTEKVGYNESDGNKWISKIYDNAERNYVENIGENVKLQTHWKEKWFDDKKGTKWAEKEGSNDIENTQWNENWHEKYGDHPIEKKCNKWGKDPNGEWSENWREEYKEGKCVYKVCVKIYKSNELYRKDKVEQHTDGYGEDGKALWKYKVEHWENESYEFKELEKYE